MNTDAESAPGALVNQSRKSVAPAKMPAVGAKPKAAHAAKPTKVPRRPPQSSRTGSRAEKLVCRYCGNHYPVDHMTTGKASCAPVPLEVQVSGATVKVKLVDLMKGRSLF